jgi:hypothetical protein
MAGKWKYFWQHFLFIIIAVALSALIVYWVVENNLLYVIPYQTNQNNIITSIVWFFPWLFLNVFIISLQLLLYLSIGPGIYFIWSLITVIRIWRQQPRTPLASEQLFGIISAWAVVFLLLLLIGLYLSITN